MKMTEIEIDRGQVIDLQGATKADLSIIRQTLVDICNIIDYQIEMAKATYRQDGVRADQKWMVKAQFARKMKSSQLRLIQDLEGALKRQEQLTCDRHFIALCKERLAANEQFAQWMSEAAELARQDEYKVEAEMTAILQKFERVRAA